MARKWVVADGTDAYNAVFFSDKSIWSPDRFKAKLFDTKTEADRVATKQDSNAFEVETDSLVQPFAVVLWSGKRY